MRILFVVTRGDALGGAQVHVRDLARALTADGHTVGVAAGGVRPLDAARNGGSSLFYVPSLTRSLAPLRDSMAIRDLRRVVSEFAPDLVSTHSSKAGMVGRLAAAWAGVPAIFTAHGWAFTEGVNAWSAVMYRLAERAMVPFTRQIVTVSEFDRELARKHRIAPLRKLRTIHNGMPELDPPLLAEPECEPATILCVARFEPQKDHATLFQALASLTRHRWRLDLAGDGPGLAAAERRARDLGLADRVRFLGERIDVPELMAESQLYVLATNWEGLPRSIIEAMRAGLPVVASNVGGVRELVVDGSTGRLVPRGNARAMALALEGLLTDPSERALMGRRGWHRFRSEFTFERMYQKTLDLYEEVVG